MLADADQIPDRQIHFTEWIDFEVDLERELRTWGAISRLIVIRYHGGIENVAEIARSLNISTSYVYATVQKFRTWSLNYWFGG